MQVFERLKEIHKDFRTHINDAKIDSIQLLGGISRIPIVQKMIEEIFGQKVEFHMNGDDSPALGASYYSATLSPSYRIKKVEVFDGPNYEILCEIKTEEKVIKERSVLFPYKTNYGTKRVLTLDNQEKNFVINIYEESANYEAKVEFDNLEKKLEEIKAKKILDKNVEIEVQLDHLGLPYIQGAYLNASEQFTETYYVKEKVKKAKKEETPEPKAEEAKQDTKKADEKTEPDQKEKKPEEEYEEVSVPKQREAKRNLKIKLSFKYSDNVKTIKTNKELFETQQKFIAAFEKLEKDKKIFSQHKNQLESFVSQLKDIVGDQDKVVYLTAEEQEQFIKKSEEIDDYVTFLRNDAKVEEIKTQIFHVEQMMRPYQSKQEGHSQRENFFTDLWAKMGEFTKEVDQIVERKKWISEEVVKGVHKVIYEKKELVKKTYESSKSVPKHEEPEFNKQFVEQVKAEVSSEIKKLRRIPKPQEDKKDPAAENSSDEDV